MFLIISTLLSSQKRHENLEMIHAFLLQKDHRSASTGRSTWHDFHFLPTLSISKAEDRIIIFFFFKLSHLSVFITWIFLWQENLPAGAPSLMLCIQPNKFTAQQ